MQEYKDMKIRKYLNLAVAFFAWTALFLPSAAKNQQPPQTPEQQENLFRADREVQGEHGFGLILCRYIIKKHDDLTRRGCKLWVESTVSKGTVMHILLAEKQQS